MALPVLRNRLFLQAVPRSALERSMAQRALLAQKTKGSLPAAHLRVLIVDDEASMRLLLRRTLDLGFYTVFEAANGASALRMIEQIEPDIVLLDINLPDMDGIHILQEIRKHDFTIGVLMVSALNDPLWVELAQKEGADGFVAKPYLIKDILSTVAHLADQVSSRRFEPLFAERMPPLA